ncbi:MAG TPA: class I SAM-dependent methyltransferase [Desulfobacterales bacterium]|nr:class I SAM-dependent methyltransferase [Desulfobacterales bacterium]
MTTLPIKWEKAACHICGRQANEPVTYRGQALISGQFGYEIHPVICDCGLIYLNPRWTATTYDTFYQQFYDDLYRLEIKPDYGIEGVVKHMVQVWERAVCQFKKPPLNILDIGCGSGHGLRYLGERIPEAALAGIEASPECRRTLRSKIGAEVIDADINGNWPQRCQGRFDFIVMRHVAEHMLAPVVSLRRIREALSPQGLIYIAVPDMMHPRTVLRDYDKWWEYWFRAVHPYYYCRETLFFTLSMAGLTPVSWGEENEEIWVMAAATPRQEQKINAQLRDKQIHLLKELIPQELT